jgi:Hydrogenase maturation factor
MAAGADVGVTIDTDRVPVRPGVPAVCEALEMDPWTATSAGTLAVTAPADKADAVAAALAARDTPVGVVGEVTDDVGVRLDGTPRSAPDQDASWPVYDRLTGTD